MKKNILNKSYLSPLADRLSSEQLSFLIVNSAVTIILNNYKSKLFDIDLLRALISRNGGFTYHPNKNIKTRAFKRLSTVLSLSVLDGLVVFIFFKEVYKAHSFLSALKDKDFSSLTYFGLLVNGHLVNSNLMKAHLNNFSNKEVTLSFTSYNLIKFISLLPVVSFIYTLNSICLTINAYLKSISKRA